MSSIGVNLAAITDYSTYTPFVNKMKMARAWIPQTTSPTSPWNTGAPLQLTSGNWIQNLAEGQAAATVIFQDIQGKFKGGRYRVSYKGPPNALTFGLGARVVGGEGPNSILIEVDNKSSTGILLRIVRASPDDYPRDISIVHEDDFLIQDFLFSDSIDHLSPFSTIRFMDWQRTNNNDSPKIWISRALQTDATYAHPQNGVPHEVIIKLCNSTRKNCWVCVPYSATDDYVYEMARLYKSELFPSLTLYVELGNEVWNSMFSQYKYAAAEGQKLGGGTNEYMNNLVWYASRTKRISEIFRSVFGSPDLTTPKLVMVAQGPPSRDTTWTYEQLVRVRGLRDYIDAYAIAPYFGGESHLVSTLSTVNQSPTTSPLWLGLRQSVIDAMEAVTRHKDQCSKDGLELIAYEGGQHLIDYSHNEQNVQAIRAANEHPQMGVLIADYLTRWDEITDGSLFMWFNFIERWTKHGAWGLKEQEEGESVKLSAVISHITSTTPHVPSPTPEPEEPTPEPDDFGLEIRRALANDATDIFADLDEQVALLLNGWVAGDITQQELLKYGPEILTKMNNLTEALVKIALHKP